MKTVLYKVNCSTVEKRCRFYLSLSLYLQRTEPKNMLKVALSVLCVFFLHMSIGISESIHFAANALGFRNISILEHAAAHSFCSYRCWILNLNGFLSQLQFSVLPVKRTKNSNQFWLLCKWDAIFFPFNGMKLPSNYTSSLDQIKFTRFPLPNEFRICLIWPSRLKKQTSLRNAMVNVCVYEFTNTNKWPVPSIFEITSIDYAIITQMSSNSTATNNKNLTATACKSCNASNTENDPTYAW